MKLNRFLTTTGAICALATGAIAQDMADSMTVVSWGGAYQNSQQKAYSEPYAVNTGTTFVWDESSNEAVAKLRAMFEAGNVTWDLVDVEGPDSQRLCDEGLAMEVDFDEILAPGADGSTPTADFGDSIINDCFIPQIVFSTTFGYRTDVAEWEGRTPDSLCAVFDLENFPGKRSLEKRPVKARIAEAVVRWDADAIRRLREVEIDVQSAAGVDRFVFEEGADSLSIQLAFAEEGSVPQEARE